MASSRVTSDQALRMQDLPPGMAGIAGILGHELRNPLSAIAALARLTMSREDLPHDVRERLAQMDRAAKRSLDIIQSEVKRNLLDADLYRIFLEAEIWKLSLPK